MNINDSNKIALKQLKEGNLDGAETLYTKILEIQPNDVNALHFLGMIHYQYKRYDSAIEFIKKALQIAPSYVDAYNNLGIILQDLGRFDDAIAYYQKALYYNPDFIESYLNLGNICQKKGLLDEAITYYQKAIQLNPQNPSGYYGLSYVAQLEGQRFAPLKGSFSKEWALNQIGFQVDNENKILYVPIHKAGSTSIKHELFFKPLFGNYDYLEIYLEMNYIIDYKYTKTLEPYKGYFKFTVVRDPYTRFMATYYMGIHKEHRRKLDLLEQLGIADWPDEILNDPNKFIHSVNREILNRDPHTALQTYMLPKDLNELDYIGQLENIEEVEKILSQKLNHQIKFDWKQKGLKRDYFPVKIDIDRFNKIFMEDYITLQAFYQPLKRSLR